MKPEVDMGLSRLSGLLEPLELPGLLEKAAAAPPLALPGLKSRRPAAGGWPLAASRALQNTTSESGFWPPARGAPALGDTGDAA